MKEINTSEINYISYQQIEWLRSQELISGNEAVKLHIISGIISNKKAGRQYYERLSKLCGKYNATRNNLKRYLDEFGVTRSGSNGERKRVWKLIAHQNDALNEEKVAHQNDALEPKVAHQNDALSGILVHHFDAPHKRIIEDIENNRISELESEKIDMNLELNSDPSGNSISNTSLVDIEDNTLKAKIVGWEIEIDTVIKIDANFADGDEKPNGEARSGATEGGEAPTPRFRAAPPSPNIPVLATEKALWMETLLGPEYQWVDEALSLNQKLDAKTNTLDSFYFNCLDKTGIPAELIDGHRWGTLKEIAACYTGADLRREIVCYIATSLDEDLKLISNKDERALWANNLKRNLETSGKLKRKLVNTQIPKQVASAFFV